MKAGLIDEVFDNLGGRIADHFEWVGAYAFITEVLGAALLALAALAVITYFIPFAWARSLNGYIGSLIIAGLFGVVFMFRHDRAENQRLRNEIKELKKNQQPADKSGNGWHW